MDDRPEQEELPDAASPDTALRRALRESDAESLARLVDQHAATLDPADFAQILGNPFVTAEILDRLAGQSQLVSAYAVRRELTAHPHSREVLAMRFVAGLYWRDLAALGRDVRVRPTVRRAADLALLERVAGLTVGERVSIARLASLAVLQRLAHDPTPRVVEAVLENPRITEGLIVQLVASDKASPSVLAQLAGNPRWAANLAVRLALTRNPKTPLAAAMPLLTGLRKQDLRAVVSDLTLQPALRQRARLLLGEARP